jgi:hypothetical protein
MGWLIRIIAIDEATIIKLLSIFKIGFVHPENAPGIVKGLILGIWRFEFQLILGFWDKQEQKKKEYEYHA